MNAAGSHIPKRLLVICLTIALLFSGATMPHSHAVPGSDAHAEHGHGPHLHADALVDWFADHDEHDADHEHEHDVDHPQDQELTHDQSGEPIIHSTSKTAMEHDDDAIYVVADRTAAEGGQTVEHFQPILFAVVADAGRSLRRDGLRLCHDPPPPISIVPIYVRMLSLRI